MVLRDGRSIELKPNSITAQRKFWKYLNQFLKFSSEEFNKALEGQEEDGENEDREDSDGVEESTTLLTNVAAVCLSSTVPEAAAYMVELAKGDKQTRLEARLETFEDLLDEPTIFKVVHVCGGVNLKPDENLAQKMATTELPQ